jgi:hypothetical protein
MPPRYRPEPVTGKAPPVMLPAALALGVDTSGDGWPRYLAFAPGAGLFDVCGLRYGSTTANEPCATLAPGG